MSTQLFDLRKERQDLLAKADAITNKCELENKRPLTEQENSEMQTALDRIKVITPTIKNLEANNTLAAQFKGGKIPVFEGRPSRNGAPAKPAIFPDTAKFILTGEMPEQMAYVGEGGGGGSVSYVIPAYEIEAFIKAYPNYDAFLNAGATIYPTDFPVVDKKIPILQAGSVVTTFSEGAGPSSSQDASFTPLTITHSKYALLGKFSEEFSEDAPQALEAAIAESIVRVAMSENDAFTAALITSLDNANAQIDTGLDYLQLLLRLQAAVPPQFANPQNAFMVSRLSLAAIRNVRDLQDRPIFDPTNQTLLGYPTILNDRVQGRVIFGNFRAGAHISRSPFQLLRINEAYRESGQVGVRFWQRAGAKFYSDAITSGSNQPLWMSTSTDVGS